MYVCKDVETNLNICLLKWSHKCHNLLHFTFLDYTSAYSNGYKTATELNIGEISLHSSNGHFHILVYHGKSADCNVLLIGKLSSWHGGNLQSE